MVKLQMLPMIPIMTLKEGIANTVARAQHARKVRRTIDIRVVR